MPKAQRSSFWKGFVYAWRGIVWNVVQERNMMVHLIVLVLTVLAGLFFSISATEWLILLLFFALVPALELVNSAVESTCDIVRDELKLAYPRTKLPRDLAAGAVLWVAVFAVIAGLVIFIPHLIILGQTW
jgi:undecaprenol kinase